MPQHNVLVNHIYATFRMFREYSRPHSIANFHPVCRIFRLSPLIIGYEMLLQSLFQHIIVMMQLGNIIQCRLSNWHSDSIRPSAAVIMGLTEPFPQCQRGRCFIDIANVANIQSRGIGNGTVGICKSQPVNQPFIAVKGCLIATVQIGNLATLYFIGNVA